MEDDIKKIIIQYVKEIESKEADLFSFKQEIDKVINNAQEEMKKLTDGLDMQFNAEYLTEEEYIKSLRTEKEKILQNVKIQLDALVKGVEIATQREEPI